ncbi:MAG: heat-shock protein Hsp20 [Desulfobulbaceae bacterium A2]|nr:MAG: heat-shock protein Hsp20 [Desulfobulbaceae bacterium A2]
MNDNELKVLPKQEVQQQGESTKPEKYYVPAVDIYESEESVTVVAEMPGVSREGITIELEENVLTLQGAMLADEPREMRALLREYEPGHYLRRFTVAETIEQQGITASLCDGMLTVVLPKAVPAKPKRIEVQVA